jgi:ferric-dicitrate binding protein FerR (iron transport regulator)
VSETTAEPPRSFEEELAADERFERRLFWRQLAIVVVVAALIALLVVLS